MGFIGYEAGAWFESLPVRKSPESNVPDLLFMQIERLFLYDHVTEELKFILSPKTQGTGRDYDELSGEIKKIWKKLHRVLEDIGERSKSTSPNSQLSPPSSNGLKSNLSQVDYIERVEKAKNYIR